jgi:glucosamine-6-phosphate deaminase
MTMGSARNQVRVFSDPEELGVALAQEIMAGIDEARRENRRFVLGCPGGRSARSTYQALAQISRGTDLGHLIIAMMDDYVVRGADGHWEHVPGDAHYSCRRFAWDEIVAPLDATATRGVRRDHVWLPDPSEPSAVSPSK